MTAKSDFYKRYMNSPGWKHKRLQTLKRDGYLCQACLKATATEVHHKSYLHFSHEPLFDLVSVCGPCHAFLTKYDHAFGRDQTIEDRLKTLLFASDC
jgi:5-methylcytosine-specific restriction endonuclease McrA